MKKSFAFVLAAATFMFCMNVFIYYKLQAVTVDTEGPTVNSISINSHNFNPGDTVPLNFDIEDDVSGINYVYLDYYQTGYTNKVSIRANYSGSAWSMYIPRNMKAGTYELESIMATDKAMNFTLCSTHNIQTNINFQLLSWNMDLTISASSSDTEPPVVSDVTFDKTNVTPGEVVKIQAKITDNSSGVKSAQLNLREVGTILNLTNIDLSYDAASGYYVGRYTAPNANKSYEIFDLTTYDNYDNRSFYYANGVSQASCSISDYQFCTLDNLVIKVTGGVEDNNAPIASKIYFSKDKVSAPSTIKAYIKASDDVSGLSSKASLVVGRLQDDGTLAINSSLGAYLSDNMTYDSATGLYEGSFNINQYNTAGKYIVSYITLKDNAGNEKTYEMADLPSPQASFDIVQSLSVDLVTGTSAKNVAEKIKNTDDYANIMIDSSQNSKVAKEIFEAIKGTNKTIYIETQGVQWVFNGKDISNLKDIDVNTTINMISKNDAYNISGIVDKAIVISFAENGELPGKALIRVKADYAFRNYIGIDGLMVYYYDNSSKTFTEVKLSTTMTDDGFYEFYINHNSSYVITNKKPAGKYVSKNMADLALNDSSVVVDTVKKQTNDLLNNLLYGGLAVITIGLATWLVIVAKRKSNNHGKVAVMPDVGLGQTPDTEPNPKQDSGMNPAATTEPIAEPESQEESNRLV